MKYKKMTKNHLGKRMGEHLGKEMGKIGAGNLKNKNNILVLEVYLQKKSILPWVLARKGSMYVGNLSKSEGTGPYLFN